jgi:hypothetical protein
MKNCRWMGHANHTHRLEKTQNAGSTLIVLPVGGYITDTLL